MARRIIDRLRDAIILAGEIVERQRDARTRERKYVISGQTLDGEAARCVVKISPTGKVVIITAWIEEGDHAL